MQGLLSCKLVWNISDYFRSTEVILVSMLTVIQSKEGPSGQATATALAYQPVMLRVKGFCYLITANLTRLEGFWKYGEMADTPMPPQLLQILVRSPFYPCPSRVHSQMQEVRLRYDSP